MTDVGLPEADIAAINAVFRKYPQIKSVILYGSRANKTFRNGSDIDLSVFAEKLTLNELFEVEQELDDLLLPWKIDLSLFHQIEDKELLDHIKRIGIKFYNRGK
ncbi:nucleotidyltransferase domain-containing protein [Algoriphagus persicinus]|uniref:nucleotidyltransferase domain-containing protein n=1 Tax=Algoriphagus persicinus TaxID=3108754 RepID=UPI002B3E74AF|nr:nucleotidyltransferase domain-containing protein [Algoriphagus sp. E1-3-M2]MEB2783262.1 nucleotidyltransferase domain-containing protein [Algoriphagus sp. E1-3-M2]